MNRGLTRPVTSAPISRAIAMAARPTAPVAPLMNNFWPRIRPAFLTSTSQAVTPATGRLAASANESLSGFFTTRARFVMSFGANAPELFMDVVPITASPGLRSETFAPTASTVPAKSVPMDRGNFDPVNSFMSPLRIFQSKGLIEAKATRTSTSSACGSGSVKDARCTNSALP